jgi:hypothetical protein
MKCWSSISVHGFLNLAIICMRLPEVIRRGRWYLKSDPISDTLYMNLLSIYLADSLVIKTSDQNADRQCQYVPKLLNQPFIYFASNSMFACVNEGELHVQNCIMSSQALISVNYNKVYCICFCLNHYFNIM